ncbi:hypothetical protein QUA44_25960 [Microcoleus sp. N9_A2]|uniref:hypothetical protein n=1 Tax=unclassified Microcoleus TaxID=2642155 RepID=UPI002FD57E27
MSATGIDLISVQSARAIRNQFFLQTYCINAFNGAKGWFNIDLQFLRKAGIAGQ